MAHGAGRSALYLALALAAPLAGGQPAYAAEKITIMVGGLEKQIYLPFMLTQRLGYFKDQGLDQDSTAALRVR